MSDQKLPQKDDPKDYETIRMIETDLEDTLDKNRIVKNEVVKRDEVILSASMVKYCICLVSSFMILLSVSLISFALMFNKMIEINSNSEIDDIFTSKPVPEVKPTDLTIKITSTTQLTTTTTTTTTPTTKTSTTSSTPPMITTSLPFTTLDYSESKTFGESLWESDSSSDSNRYYVYDSSDFDWSDLWSDSSSNFTYTS